MLGELAAKVFEGDEWRAYASVCPIGEHASMWSSQDIVEIDIAMHQSIWDSRIFDPESRLQDQRSNAAQPRRFDADADVHSRLLHRLFEVGYEFGNLSTKCGQAMVVTTIEKERSNKRR